MISPGFPAPKAEAEAEIIRSARQAAGEAARAVCWELADLVTLGANTLGEEALIGVLRMTLGDAVAPVSRAIVDWEKAETELTRRVIEGES